MIKLEFYSLVSLGCITKNMDFTISIQFEIEHKMHILRKDIREYPLSCQCTACDIAGVSPFASTNDSYNVPPLSLLGALLSQRFILKNYC